jgi:nuclear-control-of-ATPase protein 2
MSQNLLVTSLFPHLSAAGKAEERPKLAIIFSPYLLAAQEARLKRTELQKRLDQNALRIGHLTATLRRRMYKLETPDPSQLFDTFKEGVTALEAVLAPDFPDVPDFAEHSFESFADCGLLAERLLQNDYQLHARDTKTVFKENGMPSALVRTWPRLVFYPVASVIGLRIAYNSREAVYDLISNAKETFKGFVQGWVVQPVLSILDTIRHGQTENSLAIMGKASLDSDLSSLERMVIDFGRDTQSVSPELLQELGAKVREGDLTLILKEWEKDIKVRG